MSATASPFTPQIVGWAQAAQRVYQIPASLSLSAAMVESTLGLHTPPNSNNWFGIKSSSGVSSRTREQTASGANYIIDSDFAVYPSAAAGFMAYGKLLGLGSPYHNMVTKFLQSARAPADVQTLTNSLTGVYASEEDPPYGSVLIGVQKQYNLYQYDALTTPVPAPAPAPITPIPAPAPTPTPVVPVYSVAMKWSAAVIAVAILLALVMVAFLKR
jgi:flagellum-specific peptidoglycan hydrolase FlgJ